MWNHNPLAVRWQCRPSSHRVDHEAPHTTPACVTCKFRKHSLQIWACQSSACDGCTPYTLVHSIMVWFQQEHTVSHPRFKVGSDHHSLVHPTPDFVSLNLFWHPSQDRYHSEGAHNKHALTCDTGVRGLIMMFTLALFSWLKYNIYTAWSAWALSLLPWPPSSSDTFYLPGVPLREMNLLGVTVVLGLLAGAWAQMVPNVERPACDSLKAETAALVAQDYLNAQHRHGYKYALNRIEDIKIYSTVSQSI